MEGVVNYAKKGDIYSVKKNIVLEAFSRGMVQSKSVILTDLFPFH